MPKKKKKKCKHNKLAMEAQQYNNGEVVYFCRKCNKWIKQPNKMKDQIIEILKDAETLGIALKESRPEAGNSPFDYAKKKEGELADQILAVIKKENPKDQDIIKEFREFLRKAYYEDWGNIEHTFYNSEDFANYWTPKLQDFWLSKLKAQRKEILEKEKELLERLKLEFDVCVCECGEKLNETDAAQIVEKALQDIKELLNEP